MPKLTITRGLPGSGKSTWAKEVVEQSDGKVKRVNKDDLRKMMDCGKWSKDNEVLIRDIRDEVIWWTLDDGYDVIVDDTNLTDAHMAHFLKQFGHKAEVYLEDKFMGVGLEECIRRDSLRETPTGEDAIRHFCSKRGITE